MAECSKNLGNRVFQPCSNRVALRCAAGAFVIKAAKRTKRAHVKMLKEDLFLETELKNKREDEKFGSVDDSLSS